MTAEPALPPIAEVVALFERALCDPKPVTQGPVLPLLLDLHDSNRRQWDLEDVTRAEDASDSVVAGAKRAVDRLNLARHQLIQKIDAAVETDLDQSTTATLATETPGMVFDRLSVLVIRLVRTAEMADSDCVGADEYRSRLPSLQRQLSTLSTALESLVQEVRAGTRRFLPYEPMKLYVPRPPTELPAPPASPSDEGGSPPG